MHGIADGIADEGDDFIRVMTRGFSDEHAGAHGNHANHHVVSSGVIFAEHVLADGPANVQAGREAIEVHGDTRTFSAYLRWLPSVPMSSRSSFSP